MWVWYKLFGFLLGPSNFFAWGLSVMFLVFTLRAILYKPFVRQIRTTRQMQELQPQIKALQKKYGKDRQRMALEMQKLQTRARVQPDPGLPSDAGADPGVPRAVPRAAVVQPDPGRLRPAQAVAGAEPLAGQLRLQRDRRRALPGRQPVRCAAGRQHDSEDGAGRVHGIQPGIGDRGGRSADDRWRASRRTSTAGHRWRGRARRRPPTRRPR